MTLAAAIFKKVVEPYTIPFYYWIGHAHLHWLLQLLRQYWREFSIGYRPTFIVIILFV